MKVLRNVVCTLLLVSCVKIALAQTSIEAKVDEASITADETLTYKLIVATDAGRIPFPQVPKFEGFRVISQARSSTMLFKGGAVKNVFIFVYILLPSRVGTLTIAPSKIKIKGKEYSTQSFQIEVKAGTARPHPRPQPESKPSIPEDNNEEQGGSQVTL